MALVAGTRLGPYEIGAPLGAGGMGEVYRARDTRLNRDVAIKVLPDVFAADPERVARFEREAQLLAAVNHPHIAAIYGIESGAIVLELVDGPTLADRIAAAGRLPLDEALPIAIQIAEALEAAHEKGVIHRDLKPANIKLTSDGDVKVLDFGLAKLLERDVPDHQASQSPTFTAQGTFAGVILGTAPYMSPEQARGRAVDKRTDIWAFGCVLFEMLSGTRAFGGEDVTETLGAIIHKDPPWDKLPSEVPAHIQQLLRRCLQKDPKQRLRDVGDARIELSSSPVAVVPTQVVGPPRPGSQAGRAGWIAAGLFAATAAVIALAHWREPAPVSEAVQFQFMTGPIGGVISPIVSPDGTHVAYLARETSGGSALFVRALDSLDPQRIISVQNPDGIPVWSPDSQSLLFVSAAKIRRVELSGQSTSIIAEVPGGEGAFRGGAWSRDGTILFGVSRQGLFRVDQAGGAPTPVSNPAEGDNLHASPTFLPDGRRFVFLRTSRNPDLDGIYLGSLDHAPADQLSRRLVAISSPPQYVERAGANTGFLIYANDTTLMAHEFDPAANALIGEAVVIAGNVSPANPRSYSANNNLIAFRNSDVAGSSQLTWFDRSGKLLGRLGEPAPFEGIDIATDGKLAAVVRGDLRSRALHLWSIELDRGVFTRVNPEAIADSGPAIADDGWLAFTMFTVDTGGGIGDLYRRPASGAGEPELLVRSPLLKHSNSWSPDKRYLIFDEHHPTRRQDLLLLALDGERQPRPLLVTNADETLARFSPDGRWIVYRSDESGRSEIYVRDFAPGTTPAVGAQKWTISQRGGDKPRWSPDGTELYYIGPDGMMMAVPIDNRAGVFKPGTAIPLFETNTNGYDPYDVTPDGRFLINTVPNTTTQQSIPVTVLVNWQSRLVR